MKLPNGKVVDVLPEVFQGISKWIQNDDYVPEGGGFILGYKHKGTCNISLEYVTYPHPLDICGRVYFKIRDPIHELLLLKARARKSFYMGVWHTHPQAIPHPSQVDWDDWNDTLVKDKIASEYVFFFIAGTEGIRVWVGNFKTKHITEIFELEKDGDLYKKV
ncbi:Mov34/MPN/PAD-1 family protein [Clostridium aromativorans]|nr:Mov34/MPN/PAD-1 family protein [Clostridium aromativorans]